LKILIAEDEIGIAETYQVVLESRGHKVTKTHDGIECVSAYRKTLSELDDPPELLEKNPPFDVVILDYFMPRLDGLQAAKLILSANKHQRIILASAYVKSTLEESVKFLQMVVELLEKPFDLERLVTIVEDNKVHHELKKINVKIKEIKDPEINQLRELLQSVKKTQVDTPLVSQETR
jgi:two-component system, chemotaxis family, chemotaxis protein CheY